MSPKAPPRPLAVVCLSGGMDSAVTAALALQTHEVAVLHANYGQRTEVRELSSFVALADHFVVASGRRLVVDFTSLRQIGGSSLTDVSITVRRGEPEEGVVPTSYVPFRNAHLLAAATSWAEVIGANAHPFYRWIAETVGEDAAPRWNFHKYLIDGSGDLVAMWPSKVVPLSDAVTGAIEAALE